MKTEQCKKATKDYYINCKEEEVFNKLLCAREERADLIRNLSEKYKKTVICIRANYPGLYKINEESINIVVTLLEEAKEVFKGYITYDLYNITYEGPIAILIIDKPSKKVKKKAVKIEELHPLGRLADIDVYDELGVGISRKEIQIPRRRCFICQNEAHSCVRSKAHSLEEIKHYINKTLEGYSKE